MEKMRLFYDEDGDVLDISIGEPRKTKSPELGNDVIIRKDDKGTIVGFTILNFEKRSETEKGFKIPVEAEFEIA